MGYNKDSSGNPIYASPIRVPARVAFKRTDNGSELMNIDGEAGGTPTIIWDGEGTYWTPGGTGSATTGSKHTGTYGWDTGSTIKDNTTYWDYGSDQDISAYATLTFWMQPKAFPTDSEFQIFWKTNAGVVHGSTLQVEDYVSNMDLDVWQQVTIPIEDFNLVSNVAELWFKYTKKDGQQFWFDELSLNTSGGGGPFTFRVEAPEGYIYHTSVIVLLIAGTSSGWDHDVFGSLSSALANGLLLRQRRLSTSETLWSINAKDNIELFGLYHPQDDVTFADSILLLGFMVKPSKDSILITDDDVLEYVVRDDLSSLNTTRAFVHGGKEAVS